MTVARITKTVVANLKPGEIIHDTDVRGFAVRKQRRDAVYYLIYRFKGRKPWFRIGLDGAPWTPDLARSEAKRLLGMVNSHEKPRDPATERDKAKGDPTLTHVVGRYLKEYAPAHKKPRTVEEDTRNLERHVLPVIGKLRISDLSQADVIRFQTGRAEFPANANRCVATLSHVMAMAEKWGYRAVGSNPCRGIAKLKENAARERLLTPDELARLGLALSRAARGWTDEEWQALPEKERPTRQTAEDYRAVACISLLIFTGARLSEVLTLEWSFIDRERGLARLPDSKTGAKNLHLPPPAMSILEAIPVKRGNPYVLPGDKKGTHLAPPQKAWQRIRALAGLDDVRIHDLRHCFASHAVADGHSLFLVGKVLGHRQASTTERYAHLMHDPVAAVSGRTADRLAGYLSADSTKGDLK